MKKDFLNKSQEDKQLEFMADPKNRRFLLESQKDVDQLFGKIRRLKGRNDIRKNAIKIAVKLRLNIDPLLDEWDDIEKETESNFSLINDSQKQEVVSFRYIPKAERDALPDSDFGYIGKNNVRRLFPIVIESDVLDASRLIGQAKGLTDEERDAVKERIIKIARKKKFKIPKTWEEDSKMSQELVTIG